MLDNYMDIETPSHGVALGKVLALIKGDRGGPGHSTKGIGRVYSKANHVGWDQPPIETRC
jgi:hypothetical protein